MCTIKIQNLGPIKSVEFELKEPITATPKMVRDVDIDIVVDDDFSVKKSTLQETKKIVNGRAIFVLNKVAKAQFTHRK